MSEIRQTTTVEMLDVPPPEPVITLRELLAGVDWLATKDSAKTLNLRTAPPTAALPFTSSLLPNRHRPNEVLSKITAISALEVPQRNGAALLNQIEKLVLSNDATGIEALGRALNLGCQNRQQDALLKLVSKSCGEIGFHGVPIPNRNNIVFARSADGARTLTIEVDKTKKGGLELHMDADGFHGGACVETLDRLEKILHKRGVRFTSKDQRRKDRCPAFDGRRLAARGQTRVRA
jgi:hypothetical protein